jgi:carbamoyltransferase
VGQNRKTREGQLNILGIGGVLGDAAAALIKDGRIAAAIEEAKLTRRPQSGGLPENAIAACLQIAGIAATDVDYIALARPLPPGSALPIALRSFPKARVVSIDHHAAHAAAAYLPSPFSNAVVITLDREGDLRCGGKWRGEGNRLVLEDEILYPDSIGELYGRVTALLGFQARADEHRVQWLSATGEPCYLEVFRKIVHNHSIDRSYFESGNEAHGGFGVQFFEQLGIANGAELNPRQRADIAASMQRSLEDYVLELAGDADNVCLGGGVAWNALLVSALETSGRYKGVFAQPAAGNAGTALGAALSVWSEQPGEPARLDGGGYCLGPGFSAQDIKQVLENCKLRFRLVATTPDMIGAAVDQLKDNRIVAWMQGRMEFGPRALGNRSILASPQDPYSTENLNTFIKHRESVRKFAASVPAELASEYFESGDNARHLATVSRVRPAYKEQFRGAILANDLVRVHTVSKSDNPLYWQLLHAFGEKTGLPVLYNTSFNLFGEPLVCTPRDAVRSFYSSGIDAMVVGNFLLEK